MSRHCYVRKETRHWNVDFFTSTFHVIIQSRKLVKSVKLIYCNINIRILFDQPFSLLPQTKPMLQYYLKLGKNL